MHIERETVKNVTAFSNLTVREEERRSFYRPSPIFKDWQRKREAYSYLAPYLDQQLKYDIEDVHNEEQKVIGGVSTFVHFEASRRRPQTCRLLRLFLEKAKVGSRTTVTILEFWGTDRETETHPTLWSPFRADSWDTKEVDKGRKTAVGGRLIYILFGESRRGSPSGARKEGGSISLFLRSDRETEHPFFSTVFEQTAEISKTCEY
jgi:hypothetical protein